jgi:hypothetical protein
MDNVIGIIITLLIIAPFIFIMIWAFRYQKKIYARGWEMMIALMNSNGVNITSLLPPDRRVKMDLAGNWNGNNIRIVNEIVGAGKSRRVITKMVLTLTSKTVPDFVLSKENFLTRAGEKLGIKDIKTGDTAFDKVFRLTSEFEEQAVLGFFDDSLIQKLKQNEKLFMGEMVSKSGAISVMIHSLPGHKNMQPFFKTMFELMLFTAEKKMN